MNRHDRPRQYEALRGTKLAVELTDDQCRTLARLVVVPTSSRVKFSPGG